jgi:hypothetical protein
MKPELPEKIEEIFRAGSRPLLPGRAEASIALE